MIKNIDPISIDAPIICPKQGSKEKSIPKLGFLIINPNEAAHAHSMASKRGWEKRSMHHFKLSVSITEEIFVAGPAVSSPIAVLVVEKLIALGAKMVVALSWCGSISPDFRIGDVLVGSTPLSGEGTSRYYATDNYPTPSQQLSIKILQLVRQLGIVARFGRIWTTDAPYRECRVFLKKLHQEERICGVDMEYSALCTVCAFRKIDFASLFLVSDELWGEKWKPGFKNKDFLQKSRTLVDVFMNWKTYANE